MFVRIAVRAMSSEPELHIVANKRSNVAYSLLIRLLYCVTVETRTRERFYCCNAFVIVNSTVTLYCTVLCTFCSMLEGLGNVSDEFISRRDIIQYSYVHLSKLLMSVINF